MTKDPTHLNDPQATPIGSQKIEQQLSRPSGPDRQEQYQRTREQVASTQEKQDREARIRRRAQAMWEAEGRPEGVADRHRSRAANDLDREDTAIQREGMAQESPDGHDQR